MPRPRPQRRAVSQTSGIIRTSGSREVAALLEAAWLAADGDGKLLTHGIHPYPARLHPLMVRSLLASFTRAGERVVDPFMGSGTVLVEAMAGGRRAFGSDVLPVAVRLARMKTLRLGGEMRRAIESRAQAIAAAAARNSRAAVIEDADYDASPFAPYFEPQALLELAELRNGVAAEPDATLRFALEQVLSSIAIKASNKLAETDERLQEKSLRPGQVCGFFSERALEFGAALADLGRAAPRQAPSPVLALADARALPLRDRCAGLVLTSPPYLGTYDYARTQSLRARLLGLDLAGAERLELGARARAAEAPRAELERFELDLAAAFREIRRVLEPDCLALIVQGDSSVAYRKIHGERLIANAARAAGLREVARATQDRPQTYGPTAKKGRAEHLVALVREN